MGAFILFPVLIFSVFITSILGFTDWIHVDTLVHAAAQAAVTAAGENATAPGTSGIYNNDSLPLSLGAFSTWNTGAATIGTANGDFSILNSTTWDYQGTGSPSSWHWVYSQPVTVTPGETLTLSADINATSVTSGGPAIQIYSYVPSIGMHQGGFDYLSQNPGTNSTVSGQWTVPAGITQVVVLPDTSDATVAAGQPLTWSNIQLTQQPASLLNPNSAPLDTASVDATVGQMLNGKPYITSYSCTVNEALVTCKVNFNVSMPIVGTVHATTTVSATNTLP